MEQHPVPQNISSYQFHLVGDMTLKQFLELAGGVLVGVLIYVTGLPSIIKWPLIFISAGIGAALAFIPFEERPLERWVVAFFRGVYSPTLFHWEKQENVKYFADETTKQESTTTSSQASKIPFLNKLETGENSFLNKLGQMFSPAPNFTNTNVTANTTVTPVSTNSGSTPINVTRVIQTSPSEGEVLTVKVQRTQNEPQTKIEAPSDSANHDVKVPQTTFISLGKQARPQVTVQEIPQVQEKVDLTATTIHPTLIGKKVENTQAAMFSVDAAPPSVPTITNTVTGQVMDTVKKAVEGAILDIVDESNRPVRALKTNKAGHFLSVTPLSPGKYKILTEKDGLNFDPIEFEANDTIVAPIAIYAK